MKLSAAPVASLQADFARLLANAAIGLLVACGGGQDEPHPQVSVHGDLVNIAEPSFVSKLNDSLVHSEDPLPIARAFYDGRSDDYDFLFLIADDYSSDDLMPAVEVDGRHFFVHQPAIPGTGIEDDISLPGYEQWPRLKGIMCIRGGATFGIGVMGPYGHELGHQWANQLDPALGLTGTPSHFNDAIVGPLGYQPTYCMHPDGATAPDCTAEANGRYRLYSPAEPTALKFSPLELYLMGLLPEAEVPSTFYRLGNSTVVDNPDPNRYGAVFETDSFVAIPFAPVVARHGHRPLASDSERHFRIAFVLVTTHPATQQLLDATIEIAEIVSNRRPPRFDFFQSFDWMTGSRATIDMSIEP